MQKKGFWHRLVFIFLALVLASGILLTACGDDEEETNTTTVTVTETETETSTVSATPTSTTTPTTTPTQGPVKIGGITAWSGPMAIAGVSLADPIIKLVEWQVKQQGGILGGRDVQVLKYDSGGNVAGVQAGAIKLFKEDNVSVLVFGGVTAADNEAVSTFADENQILYVCFGSIKEGSKFTISASTSGIDSRRTVMSFARDYLKPKKVALLSGEQTDSRERTAYYKQELSAAGIDIVYEDYASEAAQDFSPYLSKIKYDNPDVLLIDFVPPEPYVTIAKQIMELGGWGNITVLTMPGADTAKRYDGADGWYELALWVPGGTYPGSVKFENEYQEMFGKLPQGNHVYWYNCLWTAIYAIELAGTDTDRVAITEAARSGNLEWETPLGLAVYDTDGSPHLCPTVTHVENKTLVVVPFTPSEQ